MRLVSSDFTFNRQAKENSLTTITVYTQEHCQPCKATKRWLDKRGITFAEVDVTTSPDDAAAIRALGFKEAPVVIVSTGDPETDLMWSGFDPNNLTKYAHQTKAA
uniref:glutaredoxin domain-containing protein n=1 Tax=Arthrobacter silvisoli TaxID=2291022 RepID=UPI003F49B0A3